MSKRFLIAEFIFIFVLMPVGLAVAIGYGYRSPFWLFGMLWVGCCYALIMMRQAKVSLNSHDEAAPPIKSMRHVILWRMGVGSLALLVLTLLLVPERFLGFPMGAPMRWAMVMVLYPFLSAWPQEILFRKFFFWRYSALFSKTVVMKNASALAFGFSHLVFLNPIAVILATIGGWLWSDHYAKHQSLKWVWLEHSFYGCLVFTLGLGWFFFHGASHF